MDTLEIAIKEELIKLRLKKLSCDYVSKRTGISRPTVWRILGGITKMTLDQMLALEKSGLINVAESLQSKAVMGDVKKFFES